MSLLKIVLSESKLFINGRSSFSRDAGQFIVCMLPQWMCIDIQLKAMEPLFRKLVLLERHSMEGHRNGSLAAREVDCRFDMYVLARQDMHVRHIMGVV